MNQPARSGRDSGPRVSIVMPMYNSATFLESTVASVSAQTFTNWELVLYDDGSTDRTAEISRELAESDPRIKTATGRHLGVAVARNDGLRHTDPESEFIVFLDSDDTWTADALTILVDALVANPQAPAAHALAQGTDMDGRAFDGDDLQQYIRARRRWENGALVELEDPSVTPFEATIVQNWVVTPGTSIIRRSALAQVGELDPATSPADDWDLNVRLSRLGAMVFVDKVVLNWRRHPYSLANTSKRWRLACFEVRKRSIKDPTNTPQQRRIALALLASDCKSWRRAAIGAARERKPRQLAAELFFIVMGYAQYLRFNLLRR